MESIEKSFWAHVTKTRSCWEWNGCLSQNGYGDFRWCNRRERAHRISWELHHGIKPSKLILHKCDNRKCVNPAHLFQGTHLDNSMDCTKKGRHANQLKTHCPYRHEYTKENTYIHKNGSRRCKKCHRNYYLKNVSVWKQ